MWSLQFPSLDLFLDLAQFGNLLLFLFLELLLDVDPGAHTALVVAGYRLWQWSFPKRNHSTIVVWYPQRRENRYRRGHESSRLLFLPFDPRVEATREHPRHVKTISWIVVVLGRVVMVVVMIVVVAPRLTCFEVVGLRCSVLVVGRRDGTVVAGRELVQVVREGHAVRFVRTLAELAA